MHTRRWVIELASAGESDHRSLPEPHAHAVVGVHTDRLTGAVQILDGLQVKGDAHFTFATSLRIASITSFPTRPTISCWTGCIALIHACLSEGVGT